MKKNPPSSLSRFGGGGTATWNASKNPVAAIEAQSHMWPVGMQREGPASDSQAPALIG